MMAEEEDSGGAIPEWVVTFGDMMSLLLTFFIMLVSLSEVKRKDQYQALVDAMRKQFGQDDGQSMAPGPLPNVRRAELAKLASPNSSRRQNVMKGGADVKATVGENPLVDSLRDTEQAITQNVVFFAFNSAVLSEAGKDALEHAVVNYRGRPNLVEVRGHTSLKPLPKDSAFADHWDLAFARADAAMDYLITRGIQRERILLVDAGPNEPLHLDDPSKIHRNDRVEVFMLSEAAPARQ